MSYQYKYIYSDPFSVKYKGKTYYLRTVSSFKTINGRPTGERAFTQLYTTEFSGGRNSKGEEWKNGAEDSLEGFNPGGWIQAAATADGGKTWSYELYGTDERDAGMIPPGFELGDVILKTPDPNDNPLGVIRSLSVRPRSENQDGSSLYNAVQNALTITGLKYQNDRGYNAASVMASSYLDRRDTVSESSPLTMDERFNNLADPANVVAQEGDVDPDTTFSPDTIPQVGNNYTAGEKEIKGSLVYPLKLKYEQDFMVFQRHEYAPKLSSSVEQYPYLGSKISTIVMSIPSGISDNNSVEWGGSSLNEIERFMSVTAMNAMDGSKKLSEVGSNAAEDGYKKFIKDNPGMYKYYFAQEAVGVQGLLSRAAGAVLNPNLSLLFNGPSLRPFSFTFRLTPRSKAEATVVKKIIRQFKEGSAVNTAPGLVFLKAPDVWKIYYEGKAKESGSLNEFKTCALTNISVNYTPDGTYMSYQDGSMTAYELTLTFSELDPVYSDNYKSKPKEHIGF